MRKPNYKILSVILSLLMVFSVISFPKLTAKADGVDDFIGRCYQVTLGRDADSDGYAYWRDILVNRKQDGSVVAHGFLFSPEYIDKNTSNEQYIKDLYMLFMGREPEQSGYDYWCEKMTNGEDREKIFAGFANSEEYFKLCNGYGITAGYYSDDYDIQQINGVNLFVERMYQTSLDRLGDQGGQNDWVQDLLSGRISGIECARCFVQSPEFINKGLSNEAYLKSLYRAFMGREYDQNGLNYWLDKMDNGYTRDEVFAGFANSPEFEGICANYGIVRGDYTPTDIGTKKDPNDGDNNDNEEEKINIVSLNEAREGDYITFGKYEQDGNLNNGKEDIVWEVLTIKDNKALVISKDVIDYQPYNATHEEVTWETSSLRKWLNSDFLDLAFSEEEVNKIPTVTLKNEKNPDSANTIGGNDTNDKIFCLSLDEIETIYGYQFYTFDNTYNYNQRFLGNPTKVLLNKDVPYYTITAEEYNNYLIDMGYTSDVIGKKVIGWWFRTPGYSNLNAIIVDGWGGTRGCYSGVERFEGVRPALYLDLSNNSNEEKPKYEVGQSITIGQYEQDGNLENGKEDIEWEILSVEDGKILVISKYALDYKNYNDNYAPVTWETCSLRSWLNNDFYKNSFSENEKIKISSVTINNNDNSYVYYRTSGGNDTIDKVFCLSVEEVEKYYGYTWNDPYDRGFGYNPKLLCVPTQYAKDKGAGTTITSNYFIEWLSGAGYSSDVIGKEYCNWSTRTPGASQQSACYVGYGGAAGMSWDMSVDYSRGIRPAMYIEY